MTELKKPKAYFTYMDDAKTRGLLLAENPRKGVIIKTNDTMFVYDSPLPKSLSEDLIEFKSAKIYPRYSVEYIGKDKVFGIAGTKSRTLSIDGVKHIRVRIVADTTDELYKKISVLKQNMSAYGIKEKMCVWDRLGRITVDYEKPKKKIKPAFDCEYLKKQRELELQTVRQT